MHEAVGLPGGHEGLFGGAIERHADAHLQRRDELAQDAHAERRLGGVGQGPFDGVDLDHGERRREPGREELVQPGHALAEHALQGLRVVELP